MADRFWSRVNKTESCWLWAGTLDRDGYGRVSTRLDGPAMAHRLAYAITHGDVPEGLTVDHLCRVRNCVRPDHLEAVPMLVNFLRSPRWHSLGGACPRGHEQVEENIRRDPSGHRAGCRPCALEQMSNRRVDPARPKCSEDDCDRPEHAKGICKVHYNRIWKRAKRARLVAAA